MWARTIFFTAMAATPSAHTSTVPVRGPTIANVVSVTSCGVRALPLVFVKSVPAMGAQFAEGAFVGEHGSWNRGDPAGYKVVFVPFRDGRPAGEPIDFVTGFQVEGKTHGRPVGVTVDPRGALIVADDLSNTVWRVVPVNPTAPAG